MSLQAYVALATLVTLAAAQGLTVNTPTSVQTCLPVAISWTGGTPPVYVSLIPGGQPGGQIVKDFGQQNASPLTWKVDQPAGTSLSVQIRDSSGTLNYSDKFEVQPSTATCSDSGPTKPGSASPPVSTSGGSPPKPGTTPTPSNTSSSTTTPSGGSTPSSGSPPATGSTTPTSSNTGAAAAASSPAAGASSDASRTIPAFLAVVLSAATAAFA